MFKRTRNVLDTRTNVRARQAFSLLEMAVVVVIVGMTSALVLKSQRPSDCYAPTQAQLVTVRKSIDHFVRAQNRYPTPAVRNAGTAGATYGNEDSGTNLDIVANSGNPVMYGSLPFKALGLPSSFATDCWGNQFSYIITQALTVAGAVNNPATAGGIAVWTGPSASQKLLLGSVAYAVVSHGQDGYGAVSKNYKGSGHGWCGSATLPVQSLNCNINAAKLYSSNFNNGANAGNEYFDDVIIFAAKKSSNCNAPIPTLNWTVGPNSCDYTYPNDKSIASGTPSQSVSDTINPYTGDATFHCSAGSMVLDASPAPTCVKSCPAGQTLNWGTSNACGQTSVATSGGTTGVGLTSTTGTGTATADCGTDGVWSTPTSVSCTPATPPPASCPPQSSPAFTCSSGSVIDSKTVNGWGLSNCITADGSTTNQIDCWRCSDGVNTPTACEKNHGPSPCASGSFNWGSGNCTGTNSGNTLSGNSVTINNTASGYTGSTTASCTNGTWTTASGTCTAGTDCSTDYSGSGPCYTQNNGDGYNQDVYCSDGHTVMTTQICSDSYTNPSNGSTTGQNCTYGGGVGGC